jgi:glucokinase
MSKKNSLPTLGVNLGGTKVETSLVDVGGQILASRRRPTNPEKGADRVIEDIVACVQTCLGKSYESARGLGIGVAGQVDGPTGKVRFAPNLGWRDVDLQTKLEQALGMPVVVSNDVRAATYGEWRFGSGKGVDDLVCLFVGTGIGGGIVSGGQLLQGCNNTAGELGHITIVKDGRRCHCSNYGCLEAYAGGWAIAERAQVAVQADPQAGQHLISLAGSVEQISSVTVTQAHSSGDPLAHHLVEQTAQHLGAGLVGIVNAFNPCLLILGGGVIHGLPEFVTMIDHIVRVNALEAATESLRIVTTTLGAKSGVIGAAALARDKIKEAV